MKGRLSFSIFVQILLATLLPLILIFSIVLVTIAKSTFQANIEEAREKTLTIVKQSAEQVQSSLFNASQLMELSAEGLATIAGDSDKAREAALKFVEHLFERTENAHSLQMYFKPREGAFGKDRNFAYQFYRENGTVIRRPLILDNKSGSNLSLSQCAITLKEGTPYNKSVVTQIPFGLDRNTAYIGSTNYPVIRNGKVIGCIGMELLYQKSFPLIDQWKTDGSHRLLIREDGKILYALDSSLVGRKIDSLGFDPDFLEGIKNAMQQDISFMEEGFSPLSGKEALISVYPINLSNQRTRMFMYTSTPTEIVYSGAITSVQIVFFTFLIGLLLFTISLFAATRNIVRPIKRLTESANLIANGQLEGVNGQLEGVLDEFNENSGTKNEVYKLKGSLQKMLTQLSNNLKLKNLAMKAEYEKVKLVEAAAAKNRFFANMSHEIRTPMNVILGMSEILLTEKLTNDQKQFVQDIKVSSESLLDIINDILDLSRLESGKLSLLPMHYDFRVLLENICSLNKYLAKKKGLDFRVETIGYMPDYLYGDDGRLRQVLLNIIGNAIKFTNEGTVTLIITNEDERLLRFAIVDTGIGIREEDMQYLFEPFKQIDGPEVRNIKGTGLGLSICQNLIELMGGTLTIDSEYGKGSSFHVTIPKVLGDGSKVKNNIAILPFSFDPGSRVLVVDDSESNLKVAREFLRMFGITADTASSGIEAITMATNSDYDLIFMDHMMPEMDGVETTHRIRALGDHQAKTPIIALTANAVIGTREMLLASGIDDFLAKPIEKLKFQAILAKWLPENLVMQKNHVTMGEFFAFDLTQVTEAAGKTDENGEGDSKVSQITGVLTSLSEMKDLNIPLGLNQVAGNLNLYVDLLCMIIQIIPETLKKIDAALLRGDAANLNLEIHTLKGSLANLGAVELAAKATELEQLGNQGDFNLFAEKLEPFRKALEAFSHKLQGRLPIGDAQLIPSGEGAQLEEALSELRNALSGFNYEKSMEIITRLARFDWGEVHNLNIKAIGTHIKYFDYDAAMSELHRIFPRTR